MRPTIHFSARAAALVLESLVELPGRAGEKKGSVAFGARDGISNIGRSCAAAVGDVVPRTSNVAMSAAPGDVLESAARFVSLGASRRRGRILLK